MQMTTIYERNGLLIIRSLSLTDTGLWVGHGPCTSLPASTAPEALGLAVYEHLSNSTTGVPHPRDFKAMLEPILKAAGVKSWKAFDKNARAVSATLSNGEVTLVPTQSTPDRSHSIGGKPIRLAHGEAPQVLGEAVKAAIALSR